MSNQAEGKEEDGKDTKKPAALDHSNDLVIRDGFPALLVVEEDPPTCASTTGKAEEDDNKKIQTNHIKKNKWWIDETDETMKLPRGNFWSHDEAIEFIEENGKDAPTTRTDLIVKDCYRVFTARTRNDDASYSAGTTYFLPALMKPRCALEGLVQLIFQKHTSLLPQGMYKPDQSGAEWWTLVLGDDDDGGGAAEDGEDTTTTNTKIQSAKANAKSDQSKSNKDEKDEEEEEDDVGWHYDADYGLEDQAPGLLLHPRVATVTYLSNWGAPTVVTNCFTPHQGNVQTLHEKSITQAYLSYPKIGKHMAFDGRLLHGAPSDIFPSLQPQQQQSGDDEEETQPPPSKRLKTNDDNNRSEPKKTPQTRITLLVNIWLNHCPLDAELLDEEILEQLQTPWMEEEKKKMNEAATTTNNKLFRWNSKADLTKDTSLAKTQIEMSSPSSTGGVCTTTTKTAALAAAAKAKAPNDEDNDDDDTLEDEIVLCNHRVRVKYGAKMEDYHAVASALGDDGNNSGSSSLVVELAKGAMTLHVGDPVSDSEEEAEEFDDEEE